MKYFRIKKDFNEVIGIMLMSVPEDIRKELYCHSAAAMVEKGMKEKGYSDAEKHDGTYRSRDGVTEHSWVSVGPFILDYYAYKIDGDYRRFNFREVVRAPWRKIRYNEKKIEYSVSTGMQEFIDGFSLASAAAAVEGNPPVSELYEEFWAI